MVVRVVVQRCASASLLVDNKDEYVDIEEGVIVHVCFLKGSTSADVAQAVSALCACKQFGPDRKSIATRERDWSVLIVPQASLAGKQKGKNVQYHALIAKPEGLLLYQEFCAAFTAAAEDKGKGKGKGKASADAADGSGEEATPTLTVKCGVYGNRQGMRIASDGPNTHQLEFAVA